MIDIEKFKRTIAIKYGSVLPQQVDLAEKLECARKKAVSDSGMFHNAVKTEELIGFTITINGRGECQLYDASTGATTNHNTIVDCVIDLIELDTTPDTNHPIVKTGDQAVAIVNVAGIWFVFEAENEQIDYDYSERLLTYTPLSDYKYPLLSPNHLGRIKTDRLLAQSRQAVKRAARGG